MIRIEDYLEEALWAVAGLLIGLAAFLLFRVPFGLEWLLLVLIPLSIGVASVARRKPWEKR